MEETSVRIVTRARNVVVDHFVVVAANINSRLVSECGCSVAAVIGELGVGDRIIDHLVVRGHGRRHRAGRVVIGQRHAHVVAVGTHTAPEDVLHDPHPGGYRAPEVGGASQPPKIRMPADETPPGPMYECPVTWLRIIIPSPPKPIWIPFCAMSGIGPLPATAFPLIETPVFGPFATIPPFW